ncbi:MAG: hypothetical protein M3P06_02125 [Acidobacteriota bacterium]|nr:hypothetical protein [Acidobacteriota bacterium]
MKDLPFSIYDFFAYLASGFVLLLIGGYAFDINALPQKDASSVLLLAWVIAAYVTGHVVAHVSGSVIETTLVRRRLGTNATFFSSPLGWRRRFFRGYLEPLPVRVIERVLSRAAIAPDPSLFFHCWALARQDPATFVRMNTFLNLYGFARNIAMACALGVIALTVGALRPFLAGGATDATKQWLIVPVSTIGVVMFYRYLKFLRLYALELYVTYAEHIAS